MFLPLSDINLRYMKNVKTFPFSVLSKLYWITVKRSGCNTKKEEIIKENYLLIVYKGGHLYTEECYTTLEKGYIIHTFSKSLQLIYYVTLMLFLFFRLLKSL